MSEAYLPPTIDWVAKQVELYEGSGGTEGTTLLDTGLPCILVTHRGVKTGALRKTPLMTVKVDEGYVLIGSYGGAPK
ncbi:MAG: nitroreductase/quinone reductase family protein, partial [Pseudomonadota bacterium]|nr:nitroreductase/quinone reductase family protein [Pseudomonadota bacterium]